jgi:ubiquinone/menaquinone biosynthesis C-methylase UbiE
MLAAARQEADRQGQSNVRFEAGNVYRLAFEDDTFDVVHAHQVLQHCPTRSVRWPRCGGSAVPAA